jgi:hypothetical protein
MTLTLYPDRSSCQRLRSSNAPKIECRCNLCPCPVGANLLTRAGAGVLRRHQRQASAPTRSIHRLVCSPRLLTPTSRSAAPAYSRNLKPCPRGPAHNLGLHSHRVRAHHPTLVNNVGLADKIQPPCIRAALRQLCTGGEAECLEAKHLLQSLVSQAIASWRLECGHRLSWRRADERWAYAPMLREPSGA